MGSAFALADGTDGTTGTAVGDDTSTQVAVNPSFSEFYAEQFLPMVKFATLLHGNVEVARDVVQDSFVKLHVRWAGVEHPKAYVRTTVINGVRSRQRWEGLRRGRPVRAESWVEQDAEELNDVLATLSIRQRAAIVLRFYEQRSEAEIADILNCRPGTVGSLISRALDAMKNELSNGMDAR